MPWRFSPKPCIMVAWVVGGLHMRLVLVAFFALAATASAADFETPDVFIAQVFAKYQDRAHWPKHYSPCQEFCEPGFASLVAKAGLDYDPICQCSGSGGRYGVIAGKMHGADGFEFTVRDFNKADRRKQWIIMLRSTGGHWKISDVQERTLGSTPSLRQRLSHTG